MASKVCRDCKAEKDLSDFYEHRAGKGPKDGRYSRCKLCHNALSVAWAKENREKVNEIGLRSSRKNKAKRNAASRQYYWNNAERMRAAQRTRIQELKDAAYAAYGGYVCSCCGEREPMFLCLDHINDDGAAHRKTFPTGGLYEWLRKHDYPPMFQVLCPNCNMGKRMNGGTCPHQTAVRLEA